MIPKHFINPTVRIQSIHNVQYMRDQIIIIRVCSPFYRMFYAHRKRIYTEEKLKVVVAYWGTELLQFLAALAILLQDELKTRLICTIFFNSYWCKIASKARNPSNSVSYSFSRALPIVLVEPYLANK